MSDLVSKLEELDEELTSEDRRQLKGILQTKVMRKALREILREAQARAVREIGTVLASTEQIARANAEGGFVRGLMRSIDILDDLTKETDNA